MYETYHQQAAAAAAAQTSNSRSNTNNEADATESVPAAASAGGAANTTLHRQQLQFAQEFWEEQIVAAEQYDSDFKNHPLPLARIKKVMKSDPEVKMISAEAPILFSKACEIFICEITRRAWLHAEENKRRTLQRSDVANAVSRSDQFDFLIDIVPREEPTKPTSKKSSTREDVAPEAEAYDDQQQQAYAQYYQQPAGGLPGYPHAIDPQFYQAVSHDQFQQYMQYQQQAAVYQTPPTSTGGAAAATSSTATGTGASPPPHHSSTTSAATSAGAGGRNGYPQETGASRQN